MAKHATEPDVWRQIAKRLIASYRTLKPDFAKTGLESSITNELRKAYAQGRHDAQAEIKRAMRLTPILDERSYLTPCAKQCLQRALDPHGSCAFPRRQKASRQGWWPEPAPQLMRA
jgi:hypothetical protein